MRALMRPATEALFAIAGWCKADAAFLLNHDFGTGTGAIERAIGIGADAQASYRHHHGKANAWLQAEHFFRGANAVVRGSDILDAHAIKSTPFYRSWLKPIGILPHLFAVLERQNGRGTFAGAGATRAESRFQRRDRRGPRRAAAGAQSRGPRRCVAAGAPGARAVGDAGDRSDAVRRGYPRSQRCPDRGQPVRQGGDRRARRRRHHQWRSRHRRRRPADEAQGHAAQRPETTSKAVADHLSMLSVPRASENGRSI
ncbi:MAG: hypothetical protein IPK66_19140 [Rhodospirillales bacterium]|nr:hypothetical protein [Rhodospirillales bacterium]